LDFLSGLRLDDKVLDLRLRLELIELSLLRWIIVSRTLTLSCTCIVLGRAQQ
jgi:hypothetical protein